MLDTKRSIVKRQLFKANLGGNENNPYISGKENKVIYGARYNEEEHTTLLRKAGNQIGKILEGGTDIAIAPAKWLAHMQENWLTYIVCATILMTGILFIYCYIRRKVFSRNSSSFATPNIRNMLMEEAIKLATFRRALEDA